MHVRLLRVRVQPCAPRGALPGRPFPCVCREGKAAPGRQGRGRASLRYAQHEGASPAAPHTSTRGSGAPPSPPNHEYYLPPPIAERQNPLRVVSALNRPRSVHANAAATRCRDAQDARSVAYLSPHTPFRRSCVVGQRSAYSRSREQSSRLCEYTLDFGMDFWYCTCMTNKGERKTEPREDLRDEPMGGGV